MRRKAKGEKRGGESKREAKWKGGVERKGEAEKEGRVASWLLGGMDAPRSKNGQNFAF